MANIMFDLTTDDGRKSFHEYCEKFDYDLYVEQLIRRKAKLKLKRKRKKVTKKVESHPEFIRASKSHPNGFDLIMFNKLWDEIAKKEGIYGVYAVA